MIFDAKEPDNLPLHEPWYSNLSKFHRLVTIGALRPDKLMELVHAFVSEHVGYKFVEPILFDLGRVHSFSSSEEPIVFLAASPGANETAEQIREFAKSRKMSVKKFSLGASVSHARGLWPYLV